MSTSADVFCGLCEDQDITKHADQWCPECEEGLCFDCLKFHKSSKATKYHEVISIENFKKLPANISAIVHHCKEHDKRYQNYCPHHESLCCPVCIATDHNKCNDLLVIDDIIKNAKSSSFLESIEERTECLKRNLWLIIEEKNQNIVRNKTCGEDFRQTIKNIRQKINEHFDKLEEQIFHELLVTEKQIKHQNDRLSNELQEKLRAADKLQNNVEAVTKYASDLQTCLGGMSFKTRLEEEEKYVKALVQDNKLKQDILKCSLDDKILAEILSLKTIGSVSSNEILSTINLNIQGERRAQITLGPTPRIPKSFDEISLTLKCKFKIDVVKRLNGITGGVFRPNGEIVFVDRDNSRLLIFYDNEELKDIINLPNLRSTDVTSVDDKTICVSYCDGAQLSLINTDSFQTTQTIKTTGACCGVTSEQGTLYWYERRKGIQMKKQSSDHITTLVKADNDCYWCYVSAFNGRIYQTNEEQGTVCCFTCEGQRIWEFKDKSILRYPKGITVDGDSNVYVADGNECVFVLSPDGKNCRQLLGKDDGVYDSYTLCFDRNRNLLFVSNPIGSVFVYNMS